MQPLPLPRIRAGREPGLGCQARQGGLAHRALGFSTRTSPRRPTSSHLGPPRGRLQRQPQGPDRLADRAGAVLHLNLQHPQQRTQLIRPHAEVFGCSARPSGDSSPVRQACARCASCRRPNVSSSSRARSAAWPRAEAHSSVAAPAFTRWFMAMVIVMVMTWQRAGPGRTGESTGTWGGVPFSRWPRLAARGACRGTGCALPGARCSWRALSCLMNDGPIS